MDRLSEDKVIRGRRCRVSEIRFEQQGECPGNGKAETKV